MSSAHNGEQGTSAAAHKTIVEGRSTSTIPPVTVIVTLFNYCEYIEACLESVKAQTLPQLDLVVVDDCSKDDSVRVAKSWLEANGSRFAGYRLLQHKVNRGLARARNTAFEQARTEYVFVLDADNLIYPRCLERLVSALEHCDASFAFCYLEKFGEHTGILCPTVRWNPSTFKYGNQIDAMSLLRHKAWAEAGGYSEAPVMGWEDFELWFKIARRAGWGILVPEILARYRVHKGSMLNTVTNSKLDRLWSYLRGKYPDFFVEGEAPSAEPLIEELGAVRQQLEVQKVQQAQQVQQAQKAQQQVQQQLHQQVLQQVQGLQKADAQHRLKVMELERQYQQEIQQERYQVQEMQLHLAKIYASRSYKLTRPLRSAARVLRGVRNRLTGR